MTLAEFRASLSNAPTDPFKSTVSFPTKWKSLVTGNTFTIRKEPDFVYIERVFPDAQMQRGNFASIELHRDSDSYNGKEHVIFVGSYLDSRKRQTVKRCTLDYDVVITALSGSRMEGRILEEPRGSYFEISECVYYSVKDSKATRKVADRTWQNFVWIPE